MFDFPKYTETELNTWKDADFECTTPIVVCSDDIDFCDTCCFIRGEVQDRARRVLDGETINDVTLFVLFKNLSAIKYPRFEEERDILAAVIGIKEAFGDRLKVDFYVEPN